jgi:hypothetical protein
MNNEPVAWMMENPQNTSAYLTFEKPTREMKISHQAIPLYTHPAKNNGGNPEELGRFKMLEHRWKVPHLLLMRYMLEKMIDKIYFCSLTILKCAFKNIKKLFHSTPIQQT